MASQKTIIPASNGKGKGKGTGRKHPTPYDEKKEYEALQKELSYAIALIDASLKHYYERNPHFPRMLETQLKKWTIDRSGKKPRLEVFFKENKHSNDKLGQMGYANENGNGNGKVAPKMMMAAAAPSATEAANEGNLPDVYTYDEVGAPPSGPKEPRRP